MSGTTINVEVYEQIGGWGFTLRDLVNQLRGFKGNKIRVPINSGGGSILEGLSIINYLDARDEEVETEVVGYALSMASVLLSAGDVAKMPENAYFMLHNPQGATYGDSDRHKKSASLMDKMKGTIINIYHKKTGIKRGELSDMMDAETWLTAQEALDKGFIDELTDAVELENSFDPTNLKEYSNAPKELINKFSNKKNSNKMEFNFKDFLSKIKNSLNKWNITIGEDSTPEDVINALEEGQSFEEYRNSIIEEVTTQVTNNVAKTLGIGNQSGEGGEGDEGESAIVKAVNAAIKPLNDKLAEFENKLADKVANKDDKNNSGKPPVAPKVEKFLNKLESATPQGESKY